MFGTSDEIDTTRAPIWNGRLADYFAYVKDLAYYTIQVNIDEHGGIRVLAIL